MNLKIPGFDIESVIGEGAMATVYLALQRSLERKVALKIMAPALAADASFCERFLREGRTLARLTHPHVVTVHDIGNAGEHYYMAMEYLPNGTLHERIAEGLSAEQGLQYIRQIASALGYAHRQGLIHRDVKPANILFRRDGTAVLSDFGIAKSLDDRTQFTQVGFAVGTPNYMSPEQARGLDIDGRADLYALGVVLYEILVGKLPYMGTDSLSTALAHLTQPLPELPIQHSRYQSLLQRLLAKNPDERFGSAEELLAALDAQPASDVGATVILPVAGQPSALGVPSATEMDDLQAVSIEIPRAAPPTAQVDTPTIIPGSTVTSEGARNSNPRRALLAIAVTAALGLGGAAYWWFAQPSTVVAASSPERGVSQPTTATPEVVDSAEAGEHPLLMAGKKTLYQRILVKPGAQLRSTPDAATGEALPAFSVLYVYARRQQGGQSWLQVGAASDGRLQGWIDAEHAADWKQSLVLKFTERSGRGPVLFMQQAEDVERLVDQASQARQLLLQAQEDPAQVPQVVALEPAGSAVPQDQFYLMPIFDSREAFDAEGQPVQLLNVASIDPGSAAQASGEKPAAAGDEGFRTGIVLVVDTSVSMQPYIDRVRQVVSELQGQLQARGELDNVSFGLVGYRNSTQRTPGLQYLSKILVSLQDGSDPQRFLQTADQVQATQVSSHSFNEDAFAGVMQAVEGMDWSGYGGRLILLVSDAGALRKNDPYSSTRMNEAEVRQAALSKQIKIFALHLLTPAGKANHASAEQQYRVLTADSNPQIGDLYVSVPGGDVQAFGERVRQIGSTFAELAQKVREQQPPLTPQWNEGAGLAAKSQAIGYAMHMDFLGRRSAVQAPQLVSAWTADRDLGDPSQPTLQVCVMLTKLQLNDLQQSLKLIVDAARMTKTSPADFFSEIASASAYMSRDPSALDQGANLAQSGVLGEYLEGLPYRSKALSMTQDLWLSLSVAEQEDFIDELESKIRLYETFHNDMANWVRFGNAEPGDALYRVPLATLP